MDYLHVHNCVWSYVFLKVHPITQLFQKTRTKFNENWLSNNFFRAMSAKCSSYLTPCPNSTEFLTHFSHCHIFDPLFLSAQSKEEIHTNRTKKTASKNIKIWLSYGSSKFAHFGALDQISNWKVWRHRSKNSLEWRHRSISMKSLCPFQESGRWRKELFRSSHQLQHKSCKCISM